MATINPIALALDVAHKMKCHKCCQKQGRRKKELLKKEFLWHSRTIAVDKLQQHQTEPGQKKA